MTGTRPNRFILQKPRRCHCRRRLRSQIPSYPPLWTLAGRCSRAIAINSCEPWPKRSRRCPWLALARSTVRSSSSKSASSSPRICASTSRDRGPIPDAQVLDHDRSTCQNKTFADDEAGLVRAAGGARRHSGLSKGMRTTTAAWPGWCRRRSPASSP